VKVASASYALPASTVASGSASTTGSTFVIVISWVVVAVPPRSSVTCRPTSSVPSSGPATSTVAVVA
jgi:hypothetical protein